MDHPTDTSVLYITSAHHLDLSTSFERKTFTAFSSYNVSRGTDTQTLKENIINGSKNVTERDKNKYRKKNEKGTQNEG
jgi:hypothetical protein